MLTAIRARLTRAGFDVVAELPDGAQLADTYATQRPDLVLVNMRMGPVDGPDAIVGLLAAHPDAVVVVLSGHDDDGSVTAARTAGAAAFIHKTARAAEMTALLHEVAADPRREFVAVLPDGAGRTRRTP